VLVQQCKEHKAATKRMEIYQVPDILVICIKRFSGSGYRSNKVSRIP
jgi:ubiquitin C-terminal hydrolase